MDDIIIGLETHVQLNSMSKMFCYCRNPATLKEEPEPNTLTCPTCLGMPGSKPFTNENAVRMGLKIAIALNCRVNEEMFFSRKGYFYPDMSKNYQITQYEIPVGEEGHVMINVDGKEKRIRIRRIHLEEDPAKIVHVGGMGGKYTLIDYNRSGIPLVEIVTDPDFSSPREARVYLNKLVTILEYLGVYDSSSRAIIKSDANISMKGGNRVEIKNITGVKDIEQALNYEILRQKSLLMQGQAAQRGTRAWNPDLKVTQELRGKEEEAEYGYIFEPDLTEVEKSKESIRRIGDEIPELPDQKLERFMKEYNLSAKVVESLVSEMEMADLFEYVAKKADPKVAGSWISGYLKKTLNYNNIRFKDSGIRKEWILKVVGMFSEGRITDRNGEMIMRKLVEDMEDPEKIMKKYGFEKISGSDVDSVVKDVIDRNGKAVDDYRKGEEKSLHFLVGQVMRESKGSIDANQAKEMILRMIK